MTVVYSLNAPTSSSSSNRTIKASRTTSNTMKMWNQWLWSTTCIRPRHLCCVCVCVSRCVYTCVLRLGGYTGITERITCMARITLQMDQKAFTTIHNVCTHQLYSIMHPSIHSFFLNVQITRDYYYTCTCMLLGLAFNRAVRIVIHIDVVDIIWRLRWANQWPISY